MELIRVDMPVRDFVLYDLSDLHVGSPNCNIDKLQRTVNAIKANDRAYLIFKGDAIEAITPGDKRYTHSCVMDEYKTPKHQADKVIEMFTPIKDKILAWGTGNHELKLVNIMDFGKYIADGLGVPYGAYVFKISFYYRKKLLFKTYHTHGWGSAGSNAKDDIQRDANIKAALKHRLAKSGHADCIYMSRGHDHQLHVVDPTVQNRLYLTTDDDGIHQHYHQQSAQNAPFIPPDSRWYATTGSYRGLYAKPGSQVVDYGEMAGYAPSEIGHSLVTVTKGEVTEVRKDIP